MKITYIRHSKVLFKWKAFYDSESFDIACQEYDSSPIEIGTKIECNGDLFYTSNLLRTEDTVRSIIGNKKTIKLDSLNEIPLVSFRNTKFKLPTLLWMLLGRLQWYFNNLRQTEIRRQSKDRINKFLDYLESNGQDCVIIGHGFYFAQMVEELKKRGVSGNMKRRIKNGEMRVFNL